MKFRKKPIVIEATEWFPPGDDRHVPIECVRRHCGKWDCARRDEFVVETLEGVMNVSPGDYIITGVNGEKYPCKPDIFEKTYDAEPTQPTEVLQSAIFDFTTAMVKLDRASQAMPRGLTISMHFDYSDFGVDLEGYALALENAQHFLNAAIQGFYAEAQESTEPASDE